MGSRRRSRCRVVLYGAEAKVLLDTVALYRANLTLESLPRAVQELVLGESNLLFVSLVSAWELAIKSSLGKVPLPCPMGELFPQAARDLLAQQLEIDLNAMARVAELPPLHRDPFDRLIIAQALLHECTVVTSDTQFAAYGVNVIWQARHRASASPRGGPRSKLPAGFGALPAEGVTRRRAFAFVAAHPASPPLVTVQTALHFPTAANRQVHDAVCLRFGPSHPCGPPCGTSGLIASLRDSLIRAAGHIAGSS